MIEFRLHGGQDVERKLRLCWVGGLDRVVVGGVVRVERKSGRVVVERVVHGEGDQAVH